MELRNYQKDIISKTRQAFKSCLKPLVVLPCGSGKTVCFAYMASKHIRKNEKNKVWFLVHRQELIEQTIETFKTMNLSQENIFIGMVQTITRNLKKYDRPTLIVFDEAHHAKAKTWYNIIEYFSDVPTIGLTATPVREDGKPLGDIFDMLIQGVDSEWLIQNGYLCSFDYYAPPIESMCLKKRGIDYDMEDFSNQLKKSKIYGDIEKYIDRNKKTIIYCPSISFSKMLCERIGATHFDGDTSTLERKKIVENFKNGKIRILSNVDLIGEGFDVPDCDCVILLRPTNSLSLFIQQSMRCLRPGDNKRATIYDLVGNVYRHGLPTDSQEWGLTESKKVRNENAEPDILVRQCKKCLRVYSGIKKICPYCGNDNGLTKRQIEEEKKIELEKIEKIQKNEKRKEVGRARDYDSLMIIARKRKYKNPHYWVMNVLEARKRKIW